MQHILLRSAFICMLVFISTALVTAQSSSDSSATSANRASTNQNSSANENRTSADESFELNITERRIVERDFSASTSVEAGEQEARGLYLRVGVAVGAEEINVLLRNVRGRVRFRATLDRVLTRLSSRRTTRN